jgi:hypothetical protein
MQQHFGVSLPGPKHGLSLERANSSRDSPALLAPLKCSSIHNARPLYAESALNSSKSLQRGTLLRTGAVRRFEIDRSDLSGVCAARGRSGLRSAAVGTWGGRLG